MITLGIDLGLHGAIAVLNGAHVVAVHDMPTLRDGAQHRASVNAPLLAEIIANSHADKVYVEYVGPRPTDGSVGAFAFGRSRGIVEGICAALNVPCEHITAPRWKRLVNIKPGKDGAKDAARSRAIQRWPASADLFKRVKDDGRAEACLIAAAGITLSGA